MDKGQPVPVILKKKVEDTGPLEVNVQNRKVDVVREEQVSFDKIVEKSQSNFYITGKMTQINLLNFLQLIEKHDVGEVETLPDEEIIVSSELITRIATSTVIDEDTDDLKYLEAISIGILFGGFFLSVFALLIRTQEDLKTYAWILMLISAGFLIYYTVRGMRSGELNRVVRVIVKSLSRR